MLPGVYGSRKKHACRYTCHGSSNKHARRYMLRFEQETCTPTDQLRHNSTRVGGRRYSSTVEVPPIATLSPSKVFNPATAIVGTAYFESVKDKARSSEGVKVPRRRGPLITPGRRFSSPYRNSKQLLAPSVRIHNHHQSEASKRVGSTKHYERMTTDPRNTRDQLASQHYH